MKDFLPIAIASALGSLLSWYLVSKTLRKQSPAHPQSDHLNGIRPYVDKLWRGRAREARRFKGPGNGPTRTGR
ncbi:MAG: hypothetical protein Q7R64_03045 [bacterium]|nr:hypothetical protein [bacterium]